MGKTTSVGTSMSMTRMARGTGRMGCCQSCSSPQRWSHSTDGTEGMAEKEVEKDSKESRDENLEQDDEKEANVEDDEKTDKEKKTQEEEKKEESEHDAAS